MAAAAADDGSSILHMEPFRFGPEPWFRLFAEAFPDVAGLIDELTDAKADIASFRHAVMLAVQSNLRDMAAAGPLVVVLTQAHRLESEAVEALWYLARSSLSANLTFVIAGDTTRPAPGAVGRWD
ncbi:MAG: hypothetical protein AAFO29_27100, partial [Actinomycetota bacterium]